MDASNESIPVVEPRPKSDAPDVTMRALEQRIQQQEILSELGVMALQGATFNQLLAETARLTAEGLRAEFCKIMEYIPSESCFLVRAGVGWDPGVIGVAKVGADLASPAGFALRTGKPVISNHLENEKRFRTPELLMRHGIRRAMNVILQGDRKAFGVLEVDSRSDDEFVARLYIEQVCRDSDEIVSFCDVQFETPRGITMPVDRAISVALIIVELITNAAKYAYQDKAGGKIWVRLDRTGDGEITLSVRDEGQGLPEDFDPLEAKSLGMRIISSFVRQLGAKLSITSGKQGSEFRLKVPLSAR